MADKLFTKDEEEDFNYARNTRRDITDTLMLDGVPSNTRVLELLIGALRDTEKSAIDRARLRVSKEETDVGKQNAVIVSELIKHIDPNLKGGEIGEDRELPEPPDTMVFDVPEFELDESAADEFTVEKDKE